MYHTYIYLHRYISSTQTRMCIYVSPAGQSLNLLGICNIKLTPTWTQVADIAVKATSRMKFIPHFLYSTAWLSVKHVTYSFICRSKQITPANFCSHPAVFSVDTFKRCYMCLSLFIWLCSILLNEFLVIILTVDLPWHWPISRKTINLTRI